MGGLKKRDCCLNCTDRAVCHEMCVRYMGIAAAEIRQAKADIESMMRRRQNGRETGRTLGDEAGVDGAGDSGPDGAVRG